MERGKVVIIPDENKILQEYYEKDIFMNHLEAYQDFSNKFKLGYKFQDGDYQQAPIDIAKEGHLSLKTVSDSKLLVIYIPRLVTKRQIDWFYKNISDYSSYPTIGAFSLEKEGIVNLEGLMEIEKVINKKNMLYERKEEEENVGKKI